ncbi:MAG: polyphosphate polymerase domain-containing protein [Acidimicrobiales bacterium]
MVTASGAVPALDRLISQAPPEGPALGVVRAAVDQLDQCTLAELEQARLLRRVDTKFVLSIDQLAAVLSDLRGQYEVLHLDGETLHRYENQYFDTFDRANYRAHHNDDVGRVKYRYRRYEGTGEVFFETKHKTNTGRMLKERVAVPAMGRTLGPETRELITAVGHHHPDELVPTLWGSFFRLAIVARDRSERATIDVAIEFAMGDRTAATRRLAVAEVKQPRFDNRSPLVDAITGHGGRQSRFTKYCVGLLAVDRQRKHNAFKPVLRLVEAIENS